MKKYFSIRFLPFVLIQGLFLIFNACGQIQTRPQNTNNVTMEPTSTIYDFVLKSIDGNEIALSQYKGKKILLVNTASECGNTPQYAELEELYKSKGDKLVILGFPANNFGGQEPGSNAEIQIFCAKNYGVTFPMFEKISVKGKDKHPLYNWLSSKELNGWNTQEPDWNFSKYLINEKGELIKFFPASLSPLSDEVLNSI
jgi:glutathione peroxidase